MFSLGGPTLTKKFGHIENPLSDVKMQNLETIFMRANVAAIYGKDITCSFVKIAILPGNKCNLAKWTEKSIFYNDFERKVARLTDYFKINNFWKEYFNYFRR